MPSVEPWFAVAITCNFAGYALYLAALRRRLVEPNRASWLIWSAATAIEAVTYNAVNPGSLQAWVFLVSAIACIAVTIGIWRRASWSAPSINERVCMAICLFALIIWATFRSAYWAHLMVVAAVPISFWPTWISVAEAPGRERSPAWGLWTFGDLATLILALRAPGGGFGEYAYLFVELACHASVWLLIGLATVNPFRAFGRQSGGLRLLDRYRHAGQGFRVGATHLGKAVFAARPFPEGAALLRFTGDRFAADEVPALIASGGDRYVQVGPSHYMGPSGGLDDLVNHSCDPNAGLRFAGTGLELIALRAIAAGEEVTWDYATTLTDSPWRMNCRCGAAMCRRAIGNFDMVPDERQQWYRARNVVAPYLRHDRASTPAIVRRQAP